MTHTERTITGTIAGTMWWPQSTGGMSFRLTEDDFNYSDNSRPSLRDMVLRATSVGDFQSANIIDATVTLKRITQTTTGTVTRTRHMDIRQFPSVTDCVVELYSDAYWAGVDCFQEAE